VSASIGAPLLVQGLAEQARWSGLDPPKNGNVIHRRRGSWFLIGPPCLTNLELPADAPAEPLCGMLQPLQIEFCLPQPGAIAEPFVVDARRCIAFTDREPRMRACRRRLSARWPLGGRLRHLFRDVCPWNHQPLISSSESAILSALKLSCDARSEGLEEALGYWKRSALGTVKLRASACAAIKPLDVAPQSAGLAGRFFPAPRS